MLLIGIRPPFRYPLSFTASTGLTGGGSSGTPSLAIATSYQLPQSCGTGRFSRWNGTAWACTDDLELDTSDKLLARASGGVTFFSNASGTSGVSLAAGSSMWRSLSDRNSKHNLVEVNEEAVLEDLLSLPLFTWQYLDQEGDVLHMGPMAQDFYASFGLGEDNRHIGTADMDGVLIAGLQGLGRRLEAEQQARAALEARLGAQAQALETVVQANAALRADRERLNAQLEALSARLTRLEQGASRGTSR